MRVVNGIYQEGINNLFRISIDFKINEFVHINHIDSEKLNIVFSGCSITAGDGLEYNEIWPHKVVEKISNQTKKVSYSNLGISGGSVSEIINQVFKYFYNYGNPDVIFLLLPGYGRDFKYVNQDAAWDGVKTLDFISYFYLHQYCKFANIKLITSTWFINKHLVDKEILPSSMLTSELYKSVKEKHLNWADQIHDTFLGKINFMHEIFEKFDSYYIYKEEDLVKMVYEFDKKQKNNKKSFVASDGGHPGTSFHDFWAQFMYEKYLELNKND